MKKLLLISVIILLLGMFIFVSCATSTTTTTSATQPTTTTTSAPKPTTTTALEPIKIGHILNLTRPEAMFGKEHKDNFQLALDSVNNQIAGHPVQVIIGDVAGDASKAVEVVRKMVQQDKVVAIFGPTDIGQKFAVSAFIAQTGIPWITYNSTPINLFQGSSANKWLVGASGSNLQQPTCLADYLYNHLGYRTIDTLTQDNTGGQSF